MSLRDDARRPDEAHFTRLLSDVGQENKENYENQSLYFCYRNFDAISRKGVWGKFKIIASKH